MPERIVDTNFSELVFIFNNVMSLLFLLWCKRMYHARWGKFINIAGYFSDASVNLASFIYYIRLFLTARYSTLRSVYEPPLVSFVDRGN